MAVAAACATGAVVVDSQADTAQRTEAFGDVSYGRLRLIAERRRHDENLTL
jgi:hypothetical protein